MNTEKLKLLIADSDMNFTESATLFLSNFPDIEILGCEANGQDALHRIRSAHPDVVLFDLVLPGLDGISLLRSVHEMRNPPIMICCTRFYSDVAMEAVRTYGAAYMLFKPVELKALHPAIVCCAEMHQKMCRMSCVPPESEPDGAQRGAQIRNYIVSLGVPSKLIGCSYLTEAVRLGQSDVALTRNLSKGLYLEISRSMNTTPTRVERCIRNAISAAYQAGGLDGKMITCPSNKEFINYVLRTIHM